MMRMRLIALLFVGALTVAPTGLLGASTCTGTTNLSFSANPVSLVSGPDVTISTTTSATGDSSCANSTTIDQGRVTIQYATSDGFTPVPASRANTWVSLNAPGQNPVNGSTSLAVDLDTIGAVAGSVIGFRAHYVTGGRPDKVETHFSGAMDLQVTGVCSDLEQGNVVVGATLVMGPGAPAPGHSDSWTFRITTKNCTGKDLAKVKVQGGSNGWGTIVGATSSKGPQPTWRSNNRNEVITWTGAIDDQQTVDVDVTLTGAIPAGDPCSPDPDNPIPGTIKYLSGAWSAAWDDNGLMKKSDYSGRVSIVVACP